MTRKHFKALADALLSTKPCGRTARITWEENVRAIAKVCKANNAGFKPERFYTACGYDDNAPLKIGPGPATRGGHDSCAGGDRMSGVRYDRPAYDE